jgi:hypothetical protein
LLAQTAYHAAAGKPEAGKGLIACGRFEVIRNVDALAPFLMSIVSNGDFWLYVGSNSGFSAGRTDPDHALFPYRTADKILGPSGGGALSVFLVERRNGWALWEPWQPTGRAYRTARNLYKDWLGTAVIFEETNEDLKLRFRWRLTTSETYGLVRFCSLENLGRHPARIRYLDGFHQMLPPGVSQELYDRFSYLAGAYMRHEYVQGLGLYTLNSGITDRTEPCESLRAACAWSLGHADPTVLLSERQVEGFRHNQRLVTETEVRGELGAYLVNDTVELEAGASHDWVTVTDTGLDHSGLLGLRGGLAAPGRLKTALERDVASSANGLRKRVAAADGLQQTADEAVSVHHFANVLFNCMRGGTLPDSYRLPSDDFIAFLNSRNRQVCARQAAWLAQLPAELDLATLRRLAAASTDPQLHRLASEYLPLTFSRRHGDPSRPWNRFTIRTRDDSGEVSYGYQGNWRDIFQNWESLAQSYPACLESMLAVFLNASTADGYNPYRITRTGVEWEVENPADPWSHIGYWGDHQIIYLLRLLESCERFQPGRLAHGLNDRLFSCARIPYEIKPFDALLCDPRHSIRFDCALHEHLMTRAKELGNDGKLLADKDREVLLVCLAEKLLVPLLAKLSNLVPGGGLWLNTQRPEWNDANNALAGWGLSVVTVGYLRRYVVFLQRLFADVTAPVELSGATAVFAERVAEVLSNGAPKTDAGRFAGLAALGKAGQAHRQAVYSGSYAEREPVPVAQIRRLLAAALEAAETTLQANRRTDGLFHSYNLLSIRDRKATVSNLSLMLEGQVAVLSSGLLTPAEALALLRGLRASSLFREDQHSYLLYPDREVPAFLSRNTLPANWKTAVPAIAKLAAQGAREVVVLDPEGGAHFQADLVNAASLERRLDALAVDSRWTRAIEQDRAALLGLWEQVFHHSAFTGRSGTMFAFEGLGSIYWHMVAKLLVAAEECHRRAVDSGAAAGIIAGLRAAYFDIRSGLGFTKTPQVYGAFPTDPYSHSPRHFGAQQPGMTGQVKEEILTRWAELGVRVVNGALAFTPRLLRRGEFLSQPGEFSFVDVAGADQRWQLPAGSLAFTYCQVPVCYHLADAAEITVQRRTGRATVIKGNSLSRGDSAAIFARNGEITRLLVTLAKGDLCD